MSTSAEDRHEQIVADDLTRLIDTANAPIGIDALGKINEWSQSAERITGLTKDDAMVQDLVETFITDDHKKSVRDVLVRAIAGDKTSNYEFQRSLVRSIGKAISPEIVLDDANGSIFVDRTQFEAALLKLCINARDAISGSGEICVEIQLHSATAALLSSYGIFDSDLSSFVWIRVTDTGFGIDPHMMDKITEPFFTTKQAGEGSGLGLSSVTGAVKQPAGGLRIESEVDVGTRVNLLLHHGEGQENENNPRARTEREVESSTTCGRTVLVVDDEPGVRKLAARWLRQQGYHVLEAKSGDDALKLIEEIGGAIDVVFSDIVMPGVLDGLALAREVAHRYPNIGIQLATGYGQERRFQAGSNEQMKFPVLLKPYDLNDLAASIRAHVRERP